MPNPAAQEAPETTGSSRDAGSASPSPSRSPSRSSASATAEPASRESGRGSDRARVIVIGGGFAGLSAARKLRKTDAAITLIDRHNYHLFQPLLYQVATAALSPADIAQPIRRIFRKDENVTVLLGEVTEIDLDNRVVRFTAGERRYDYLIVAAGATHSYFGNDHWRQEAPGLKTIDDALEIRRRVLLAFEEAEQEADEASRRAKLTFVVVGGGPTGVELAGALKEIAAQSIPRDFRHIDTTTTRVILIEANDRLLKSMAPELSARALGDLESMGVEVMLNHRVTDVDEVGVMVGGERLPAENIFWAAGVKASGLAAQLGVELDSAGRAPVATDLSLPDRPQVFVVGDLASVTDSVTGKPVPGLAPAAMQMGRFVARVIGSELKTGRIDRSRRPAFHYLDKGTMATIGKARAVAEIGRLKFGGWLAWLTWSVVHILFLVTFRSKVFVGLSWVWNYLVNSKGARLITGQPPMSVIRPRGVGK